MTTAKSKTRPLILLALMLIYLIVLLGLTVFRGSLSGSRSVNFIPFATISEYIKSIFTGNRIIGFANLAGNLVIFLPLGYITALLTSKMRNVVKISGLSLVVSISIEVLQYLFACGASDIDDVILNTIGGLLGYGVYLLVSRFAWTRKCAVLVSVLMIASACTGFLVVNDSRDVMMPDAPGSQQPGERGLARQSYSPVTGDIQPGPFSPANVADDTEWSLVLVNRWNYVPEDYQVELIELDNGQFVDQRIYDPLQEMLGVARSEGIYSVVVSGYRTVEEQQRMMDNKIADYLAQGYTTEDAATAAELWVALPGASEHHLGIAVDINADGINSVGSDVYEWLNQNGHRYGFICRYPPEKSEITGAAH